MYRGQSGMWLWVLHRLTGVGILAFLFLHIADTYLVGLGCKYYNDLVFLYHNPIFRVLEWLLVGAVLYHGFNGLRVITLDFWPRAVNYRNQLFYGTITLFVLTWIPSGIFMLGPVFFWGGGAEASSTCH